MALASQRLRTLRPQKKIKWGRKRLGFQSVKCTSVSRNRDALFWSDGRQALHRPRGPGSYFFNSLPASDPHLPVTPFCYASSIACTFVQRTTSQVIGWPWLLPIRVHLEEYRGDLQLQNPPLPTETPAWSVLWPGCQSHFGETCPSPSRADLQFGEVCISSVIMPHIKIPVFW